MTNPMEFVEPVSGNRPTFAPVPARAMADEALSALDLRLLTALAAHDRFGANGIGCYAAHPRLAGLVKCHLKSLSRSLRVLAELGYIEGSQHQLNKRLRVYRVIYTEADLAVMKGGLGNNTVPDETPIGNELVAEDAPIGNRDFQEPKRYHGDAGVNILGEAYKISRETVKDNSPEGVLGNEEEDFDFDFEPRSFAVLRGGVPIRVGVRTLKSPELTRNRARNGQHNGGNAA